MTRARLVTILSRQVAIWTSVTFLYWAFGLTIGQGSAIGWTLLLVTAEWKPKPVESSPVENSTS